MAQSVCTHAYGIEALDKVKKKKEKLNSIIDEVGMDLFRCFCNCVKDVLRGNIPVNEDEKERMQKYKDCLRE